ncbi:D-alanine--D-alanine ligase [Desulfitibacter alkalitolerans]|uniref:D-alanine--D-alanine ligase n=1 Tax=Desulfitibacter alkalitolerans TaxID=264641 RepID=UPI000AE8E04E|nr:D-alanine--D-alanine ligase [Desulfitibacter alkalitolerans]
MKKIAVLLGGRSAEREISLKTGKAVANALVNLGHNVKSIDTKGDFIDDLKAFHPDLVFIALHGPLGEDGAMQGLLEILGYPYTGCGVLTSSLAMNKIYTKKILKEAEIPTPRFSVIREKDYLMNTIQTEDLLLKDLNLPLVIKAPNQGSTIGIYFAKQRSDLNTMILEAFKFEKEILIEEFVHGREVTVAIMGNEELQTLPIIEIVSHTGVYDYEAKYTKGMSDHIIPARLNESVSKMINILAEKSYRSLGCRGFARVDFIVENDLNPYVLEINTIPGMTETSLFPDAALSAGISFDELINRFIQYAVE